jgi:hypothetical protein
MYKLGIKAKKSDLDIIAKSLTSDHISIDIEIYHIGNYSS